MNIVFKKMTLCNFMSFKDEMFDFSNNHGINLICGINNDIPDSKNGAGKTNILNGLVFTLFGKTIGDIDKERIPHRLMQPKEKCETSLIVQSDENEYFIVRGIKGKSKYCQLYKFNKDTRQYDDITKSGIKETQKYIDKEILHSNMSLFLRSVLLTSDNSYNFFKLKREEKCKFIEQIFDLMVFGIMFDSIHKDILKMDKEIYALNREYSTLQNQYSEYIIKRDEYDTQKSEKIANINNTIISLKQSLDNLLSNNEDNSLKLKSLTEEKEKNLKKIETLRNKQIEIKEKYHKLDKNIDKLKLSIEQNNKLILKHKETVDLLCSECLNKFDNFYKLSEFKKEIEEFSKSKEELMTQKETTSVAYEKLDNAIKTVQSLNLNISNEYSELFNKQESRKKDINAINNKISFNESLLSSTSKEENPFILSISQLDDKLSVLKTTIEKNQDEYNHLKYVEKIVEPDMIRRLIIKDLITYLNSRIHFYLCKIGAAFTCVFDENLVYRFYTNTGETSYDNFSSGEKMRLSIATSFAFRDFMNINSSVNCNILILDEYLDSNIDAVCIKNLMAILKEFSIINKYDIYIVSHRKEIADAFFNNIITVEKTNDVSKISIECINWSKK